MNDDVTTKISSKFIRNAQEYTFVISQIKSIIHVYPFSISLYGLEYGKSQAVRLPKPVALPESVKKVDIVPLGRSRLITPAGEAWDSWFDGESVTDDFMCEREQPADQEREAL